MMVIILFLFMWLSNIVFIVMMFFIVNVILKSFFGEKEV